MYPIKQISVLTEQEIINRISRVILPEDAGLGKKLTLTNLMELFEYSFHHNARQARMIMRLLDEENNFIGRYIR